MADETKIAWTDKTHNEWVGCSSPAGAGCDLCYARQTDKRYGGNHFGIGTTPRLTTEKNRNKPYRWNKEAAAAGIRFKVFCGSMMDYFDRNSPLSARERLWEKIRATTSLDWQILTKRVPNIPRMLPPDWGNGYENVWLGATVENKRSGLRRLEQMREIPAKVRFISVEPLLEDLGDVDLTNFHWVIIGGETTPGCREMKAEWAERLIAQCREQGVSVFFKQWGGTARGAGGCLINGVEIKEWPLVSVGLGNHG